MAVRVNDRKGSKLDIYHYAIKLRAELTKLLLRDFGIKDKERTLKSLVNIKKMTINDKEEFMHLAEKYNFNDNVLEEYPVWLIEEFRKRILKACDELIYNIVYANSIYPTFESEYFVRRNYQTAAISSSQMILQEMQFIISVVPVNVKKYMPFVELIQKEINFLKKWRKSDNKILAKIRQNKVNNMVIPMLPCHYHQMISYINPYLPNTGNFPCVGNKGLMVMAIKVNKG